MNNRGIIIKLCSNQEFSVQYEADSWGRIIGMRFSDGGEEGYGYTPSGQISRAVDGKGQEAKYRYNSLGKVRDSYRYDEEGRIREIQDPVGVRTWYEYDLVGRKSRIRSENGVEVTYHYDCLNRLKEVSYGNGIRTWYEYDENGEIKRLETRKGEEILLSFRYRYDGNGNRIEKTGEQKLV